MATTGYVAYAGTGMAGGRFAGKNKRKAFYHPNSGNWWAGAQWNPQNDADSWFGEKDGATPGTPGSTGGWSQPGDEFEGSTTVYYDIYYPGSGDQAFVLVVDTATGEQFSEWNYNSGTGTWQIDATGEIRPAIGENQTASLAVSNEGRAYVFYIDSGLKVLLTDTGRTAFDAGGAVTIDANGTQSACANRWKNAGTWSIGAVYADSSNNWKFAYIDDGGTPTTAGNWSTETIAAANSGTVDDHVNFSAALLGSDTTSTLAAVTKDSDDDIYLYIRDPSTGWGSGILVNENTSNPGTRAVSAFDETNGKIYCFWADGTLGTSSVTILKRVYDVSGASWDGTPVTVLEDDGVNLMLDPQTCAHPITSTTGWMVLCQNTTIEEYWYNLGTISGGGGGGTNPKGVFGLAIDGPLRRVVYP